MKRRSRKKISFSFFCLLHFLIFHLLICAHKTLHWLYFSILPHQTHINSPLRETLSLVPYKYILFIYFACMLLQYALSDVQKTEAQKCYNTSLTIHKEPVAKVGKESSFPNSHCFPCKIIIEVIQPGKLKMPIKGILDSYCLYDTDMFEMFCLVYLHNCRIQGSFSKMFNF